MSVQPRPWLSRIDPYVPGRQALSAAGAMASNESILGASTAVRGAIGSASASLHRYPDPLADELRDELAALHGVSADQILVGNGSDELIFQLAWTYLAEGGTAVCADPAYRIDEISSYVVNAEVVKVPLQDWKHDLDAMAGIAADIAYVVNPHNPTGTVRPRDEIERFVETSAASLVVVDEAYVDFTDDPAELTAVPLVATGRVAVLRTFSKIHGLAGLRVGYLIAPFEIIATLRKVRAPFSVGTLAQAGALAACRDGEHRSAVRRRTRANRERLLELLASAGHAAVPSQANFVLVPVGDESAFVDAMSRHGISVRPGTTLGVPGAVRVSVPGDDGLALLERALNAPTEDLVAPATSN